MGLAGKLSTMGLAEVFQNLAFNNQTGTLSLEEGERKARVGFEQGRIRAVAVEGATIDYLEVARLAEAAPEETLEKAGNGRRRRTLKAYLASIGGFDEERFDRAVAARVEDEILPLFGWKNGKFSFREGKINERNFDKEQFGCCVDLDPQGVAMEAARRHDEWQTLESHIPSEKEILVPTDGWAVEEMEPEAQKLLKLIDGTRTLAEVIKAVRMKRYDVLTTVARLVESGHLVAATPEDLRELASRSRMAGDINHAVRRLEVALELNPGDVDARGQLVKLHERAGRKADAARELMRMADLQAERGDVEAARESQERAAILAPGDLDIMERIFRFHEARGEKTKYLRAGESLAAALVSQELYEDALPLYERLLQESDHLESVREGLAHCLIQLGEKDKGIQHLLYIADAHYDQGDYSSARRTYRNALTVDPECEEAQTRLNEIESGAARRREQRRKRRRMLAIVLILCGLLAWQLWREYTALEGLHAVESEAALGLAADNGDRARVEILSRYAELCDRHEFTRTAVLARETLRTLLAAEIDTIDEALRIAPQVRTTADIEFSLGRAEAQLKRIEAVTLPAELRAHWQTERERILRRIAEIRG